jgi:quercetin dioxygenase-like cupin family protein
MQLTAGDACFVPANTVHASFVSANGPPALLFVVMSPSHGVDGYEAVDVASEEPWRSLRG